MELSLQALRHPSVPCSYGCYDLVQVLLGAGLSGCYLEGAQGKVVSDVTTVSWFIWIERKSWIFWAEAHTPNMIMSKLKDELAKWRFAQIRGATMQLSMGH